MIIICLLVPQITVEDLRYHLFEKTGNNTLVSSASYLANMTNGQS